MAEITLEPVVSDTISGVAYFPEYEDLVVRFRTSAMYVYHGVKPDLYEKFHKRHPWHRIYAEVKAHPYERLSKGLKIIKELR